MQQKPPRWAKQIDQYGKMEPEQSQCLAMIKNDPERLKNTLHKGCNAQPVTTAREQFLNYLQDRMEKEKGQKPLPECPNPNEKGIKLEKFLGKEGLKYYMAAIEEESKSESFRDAVYQKSTSFYDGPTWAHRVIAPIGGPSAAGKSVTQEPIMREIAKSIPTTDKDDGNFVVSVDGGVEREMSQIRGMVLQSALAQGFKGIDDLDKHKASVKIKNLVEKASLATPGINIVIPKTYTNQMLSYPTGGIGKKDFEKYDQVDGGQAIVAMGIVEAQHENVVKNGNSRAWNTKPYSHSDIQMNKKPPCESKAYHDYYREGTKFSNQAVDNYNKLKADKKVRICVKVKSDFTFVVPDTTQPCGWRLAEPNEKWNKNMVGIVKRDFEEFKKGGEHNLKLWMNGDKKRGIPGNAWKKPPIMESTVRGNKARSTVSSMVSETKQEPIREVSMTAPPTVNERIQQADQAPPLAPPTVVNEPPQAPPTVNGRIQQADQAPPLAPPTVNEPPQAPPTVNEPQKNDQSEWAYVKGLAAQGGSNKFSKKDPQHAGKLTHSFLCIENNGEKKLFRVSGNIIGQGAEGVVKFVENEKGEKFAVKITPHKPGENPELSMMNQLNLALGDFVRQRDAKYSETFEKEVGDKQYVVMPLYPGNELGVILADSNANLNDVQKVMIAQKSCEAIQELHDQGVVHRDIKAANFITDIAENGEVKNVNVIDFGGALRLEDGKKIGKPFGTARFMPPEMGRNEILPISLQREEKIDQFKIMENKLAALEKDIERYAVIEKNPEKYNQQLEDLKFKRDVLADSGSSTRDIDRQIQTLEGHIAKAQTIGEMRSSKAELQQKRDQLSEDIKKADVLLYRLFQKEVTITAAVDIYALGKMYENRLGLNLKQLGLEKMLADDPKNRPAIKDVQEKLGAWFNNKEQLQPVEQVAGPSQPQPQQPQVAEVVVPPLVLDSSVRLPPRVEAKDLHKLQDGKISMLSESQMKQLNEIREGKSNVIAKIDGKSIFLTKEGGAFAIAPKELAKGSFGSVYVAQNLDTGEWSALKVSHGEGRKVGNIIALEKENAILDGIERLQGTLKMEAGEKVMLASVQPFAFGKEYKDINEEAENSNTLIPPEKTAIMAFKAMEALYDLHEVKGYLYRDMKLNNMLWDDKTNQCTIIDMGTAIYTGTVEKGDKVNEVEDPTIQGTRDYMAPELQAGKEYVANRKYTQKTDLFSMGEVISRLLSNTKPEGEQYAKLTELANALKNEDPQMRPTSQEALKQLIEIVKLDPNVEADYIKSAENLLQKHAKNSASIENKAPANADVSLEKLAAIGSKLAQATVVPSSNKENIVSPKRQQSMLTGFSLERGKVGGFFSTSASKPKEEKEATLQQGAGQTAKSSDPAPSQQKGRPSTLLADYSKGKVGGFLSAIRSSKEAEPEKNTPPQKPDKLGRR